MVWILVLLGDFFLEFRFEYLWPAWLLVRSLYDSYRYQGLVSNEYSTEPDVSFNITNTRG
jgi:hypothetical protein